MKSKTKKIITALGGMTLIAGVGITLPLTLSSCSVEDVFDGPSELTMNAQSLEFIDENNQVYDPIYTIEQNTVTFTLSENGDEVVVSDNNATVYFPVCWDDEANTFNNFFQFGLQDVGGNTQMVNKFDLFCSGYPDDVVVGEDISLSVRIYKMTAQEFLDLLYGDDKMPSFDEFTLHQTETITVHIV